MILISSCNYRKPVYMRVGDLEGLPFVANLGNSGAALKSYQEALRAATDASSRLPDPAPVKEVSKNAGNVTHLLLELGSGNSSALEELIPLIYNDLLRVAKTRLSRENRAITLQPTALVHECYLRLADQTRLHWQNRAHFYAVAANTMRRVLIDQARKRKAEKRGRGMRVTLQTGMDVGAEPAPDLLALDEVLQRLAEFDERKSRVIELRFFGGMTSEEIGLVLGISVSVATVGRELRLGQAWLRREMSPAQS